MPSGSTFALFAGAALLLLLIPGPAVIYIVTRGASQGRTAALVSVAGVHTGTLVHVAAAVAGLSALIVASATAFTVIKVTGAAYLVYLGIATLVRRPAEAERTASKAAARSMRRVYIDGAVLNVLNPKTAVFFLAFLPQFVDTERGAATPQLLALGATYILLGFVTDGSYALAAGWIGQRLSRSPRTERRKNVFAGTIYLALGATTAFTGHTAG
jgi:threonine/homoserine/homoserine lactone efflux protein